MPLLAVYNLKGGVGKTATTVNLAHLAAQEGARTLVWDLDPQGAATYYFRARAHLKGGPRKLLKHPDAWTERIQATEHDRLDILPSDFALRNMDLLLEAHSSSMRRLVKAAEGLADSYDHVFLDCPPSVSLLSEAVLSCADGVLVPIIPTTLSLRTLEQIDALLLTLDYPEKLVLPFFSMVDRRKSMHLSILEALPDRVKRLLKTHVPYASDVERMGLEQRPVTDFAPRSASSKAYRSLWEEVKEHLRRELITT